MSCPNVLVKVYGNLYPVTASLYGQVQEVCRSGCIVENTDIPVVEQCGDLLRISYEGPFFPLDDLLESLAPRLEAGMQGKIDYIDLEDWTLTRHTIDGASLRVSSAPLNNIMDHAGL